MAEEKKKQGEQFNVGNDGVNDIDKEVEKKAKEVEVVIERTRKLPPVLDKIVCLAAVAIGIYEIIFIFNFNFALYNLLSKFGIDLPFLQISFQSKQSMAFVLAMILLIAFLMYPIRRKEEHINRVVPIDYVFVVLGLMSMAYLFYIYPEYIQYQEVGTTDVIFGLIAIALVLEATRRSLGWILPAIVTIFLIIGIKDTGFNWTRFVQYLYLSEGIFGIPFFVMTIYVFAFIFFGAFLLKIGVSDYVTQLMISMFGYRSGGPAKAAVISSGLMGTVSGSSVANVLTTGTFTIPLMKKAGYPPETAGAVEPVASTGGQLMPPIMGAAAFIMSQFLGIPYNRIIIAAILPALIYYAGVYIFIDLETRRLGLKGLPKEKLTPVSYFVRKLYILLPIVVITVALVWGIAPHIAAVSSLGIAIWVAWVSRDEIPGHEPIYTFVVLATVLLMFTGAGLAKLVAIACMGFAVLLIILGIASDKIKFNEKFFISILFLLFIGGTKFIGLRRESIIFMSGVFGIIFSLLVGMFSKSDVGKGMFKATYESLIDAGKTSTSVMLAASSAGLIQGVLTMTGLVTSLGFKLVDLTGGVLILLLIMAMIFSLILGMGVPTTANYVITSLVAAPAVYNAVAGMEGSIYVEKVLGYGPPVALLAAHFFVFYFGILADLTPPVALAAYAGSALAGSDFWKTARNSVKYALAGYIGPYIYFSHPEMFLITVNSWSFLMVLKILYYLLGTILVMLLFGVSITGYFRGMHNFAVRVVVGALAFACATLHPIAVGLGVAALVGLWFMKGKTNAPQLT